MAEAEGSSKNDARIPQIDLVKGLAILLVLFIHAQPMAGTWIHEYVIDRAVPIFLVLFGMSSELWWRREQTKGAASVWKAWYRSRALRLMIPVWAVLAIWWPLVFVSGADVARGPAFLVASVFGYIPYLGTSWFITLIAIWVLLFPLFRAVIERLGLGVSLFLSLVATALSLLYPWHGAFLMRNLFFSSAPGEGWIYLWAFPVQYCWLVGAGIAMARVPRLRGFEAGMLMPLAFLWGVYALSNIDDPEFNGALQRLLDVPLTIALLVAFSWLRAESVVGRAFAACGVASWGIYLSQMLIYDALHLFGHAPETGAPATRWIYLGLLFVGAVVLTALGTRLRRQFLPHFG